MPTVVVVVVVGDAELAVVTVVPDADVVYPAPPTVSGAPKA